MYWPRLQLTRKESERWAAYSEPNKLQRAVTYRLYAGVLNFDNSSREDIENIATSKRARVLGLTASGDIHNVEIQIYDSAGEQYTMGFVPLTNLFCGLNADARGMATFNDGSVDSLIPDELNMGLVFGHAYALAPHIIEPNIVLDANQTLHFRGRTLQPITSIATRVHVSFCVHVWEFPLE